MRINCLLGTVQVRAVLSSNLTEVFDGFHADVQRMCGTLNVNVAGISPPSPSAREQLFTVTAVITAQGEREPLGR